MVVSFTSKNIDEPVSYPIGANFAALLKNVYQVANYRR